MSKWNRRDFLKTGLTTGSLVAFGGAEMVSKVFGSRETPVKAIVLGFDGMDYHLVKRMIDQGKLPTFRKLAYEGGFRPLRTSMPPQSPVAWSNFITGMNPGGHAIFDFIHRDPKNYFPFLSTSSVKPPEKTFNLGKYVIPLSGGEIKLLRKGKAFWQILEEHDIPATVFKMPSNFPPAESNQRTISGMGTPDILGSYGIFNYYTTEPTELKEDIGGGKIHRVRIKNNKVTAKLLGPKNDLKKDRPDTIIDFKIYVDPKSPIAKIVIQDHEFILKVGEWSDWKRVKFKMIPTQSIRGICNFYLKAVRPHFKLYVSPINIDPASPVLPISTPDDYAQELEKKFGPFYTKGLPADTKALDHGVLNEDEFLQQDDFILEERQRMFDYELERFDSGLFFYYVSSTDQRQHMFWRFIDKEHPAYDPVLAGKYGGVIEDIYMRMDTILAKAMKKADKDTVVFVMSDHGFTSYSRSFNLNTWLKENGYIKLKNPRRQGETEFFLNTDWSRTKAYALGLNGLYINLRGREGKGIINPGVERENLVREIARQLEEVTDPKTGEKVISHAYVASDIYKGPYVSEAPDILVGYNRSYRASWATPLGRIPKIMFEDNLEKWSGDHCMDSEHTPGIVLANRKIKVEYPALYDLTVSMLKLFDIEKSKDMVGVNII
jgi:predicted AlkP superfamily phosphohydrolase/phosphomutase